MSEHSNETAIGDRLDNLRLAALGRISRAFRAVWRLVPRSVRNFWPFRIIARIVTLVRRNRVLSLAAEISFWGVLSVVPLMIVAVSALGWLDAIVGTELANDARTELSELVTTLLGTEGTASSAVDSLFERPRTGAFTIGVITAIYSASRGFTSLVGALGLISGHQSQRNWLMTRVIGVVVSVVSMVIVNGLLILLGIGRQGFGLEQPWSDVVGIGIFPVAFALVFVWALVLLHWAPQERTALREDYPGALLTTVFWIAGSYLTAIYITGTSNATDPVGLLGSGLGLLIWLYVISSSILIGAQLNAAIHDDSNGNGNDSDTHDGNDAGSPTIAPRLPESAGPAQYVPLSQPAREYPDLVWADPTAPDVAVNPVVDGGGSAGELSEA